jgi:hypothetical protein
MFGSWPADLLEDGHRAGALSSIGTILLSHTPWDGGVHEASSSGLAAEDQLRSDTRWQCRAERERGRRQERPGCGLVDSLGDTGGVVMALLSFADSTSRA